MVGVVYVPPIDSSYIGIKQDIFGPAEFKKVRYNFLLHSFSAHFKFQNGRQNGGFFTIFSHHK